MNFVFEGDRSSLLNCKLIVRKNELNFLIIEALEVINQPSSSLHLRCIILGAIVKDCISVQIYS